MKQYMEFKQKYPDCLILFRMGDFYETFYDDAKLAAKVLNITLTKRGTKIQAPLAGIPYHALEGYLAKLVRAGIKTAICEQIEDPKKAKGIVKRDVVRVVTPGTIIDAGLLDDRQNNYIVSIYPDKKIGIAVTDLSTGEFKTTEIEANKLLAEINRINPSEIIYPAYAETSKENKDRENKDIIKQLKENKDICLNSYEDRFYFHEFAQKNLLEHFNILSLDGFGIAEKKEIIAAAGALISYLKETQKTNLSHINTIRHYSTADSMVLDKATIRNLELIKNIRNNAAESTLLNVLDRTNTAMGSRQLRNWLLNPLLDAEKIRKRLDAVEYLFKNIMIRHELKERLNSINDIERLISRINYGNCNARDMIALKNSLRIVPELKELLANADNSGIDLLAMIKDIDKNNELKHAAELIETAIKDDPPVSIREGSIIKKGYDNELDELHDICRHGRRHITEMEEKERVKTAIKSLKIKFNRVFGYYIEITKANLYLVPQDYIRKQTIVNGERYVTQELKEYEEKILGAEERIFALEYELFQDVCRKIIEKTKEIQKAGDFIAMLDVLLGFSINASENNYSKPAVDNNFRIMLAGSRHPVIEKIEEVFIPNDIILNQKTRMMIITGPNMSGKSTVQRQVALITLMAQIGSFVPAQKAEIGIVDRIFTRVGAHDDLTHGQSTFMVEMSETASILNNATEKSLIIMDEIGRGTSTFDGVSIAWSVAEYIIKKIKAKTMFATHYHVLTQLEKYEGVRNYNIAVKEDKNNIIFLRKLIEGGTDKSYGVHVARLAGMPNDVIENAKNIQNLLEEKDDMKDKIEINNANENKAIDNGKKILVNEQKRLSDLF